MWVYCSIESSYLGAFCVVLCVSCQSVKVCVLIGFRFGGFSRVFPLVRVVRISWCVGAVWCDARFVIKVLVSFCFGGELLSYRFC